MCTITSVQYWRKRQDSSKNGRGKEGIFNVRLCVAALAHQADFDVCWCKGSVSERIFLPLVDKIKSAGGKILGSTFATDVKLNPTTGRVSGVVTRGKGGETGELEADAVVFAISVTGDTLSLSLSLFLLLLYFALICGNQC